MDIPHIECKELLIKSTPSQNSGKQTNLIHIMHIGKLSTELMGKVFFLLSINGHGHN